MDALSHTALIGIDWGLTQLRAYRIGETGEILEQRASARGILSIPDKAFAPVLQGFIEDWLAADSPLPLYLCGMIGSRNGWYEAPYSGCPASLAEVAERALRIETSDRQAWLIGGLSFTDTHGQWDVIRGEETQIFGALAAQGSQLVVTPGTHSKWAVVRDGHIEQFRTHMTGELYAVLSRHSSLGWWMKEGEESVEDETSFFEGVNAALRDPDLPHVLFTVRTRALFEERPAAAHAAYLSGILIGHEVESGLRRYRPQALTLIGSPRLTKLYRIALSAARVGKIECVDGNEAVARGLWRLWQARQAA